MSVNGAWEARFSAAHVDESEGWPSSRFRWECCHSYRRRQNMLKLLKHLWLSRCETGVKEIQLCIHAAADPERATQTLFSTTPNYLIII